MILILLFLSLSFVDFVYGCSCLQLSQDDYLDRVLCKADFVIAGKVVRAETRDPLLEQDKDAKYTIDVDWSYNTRVKKGQNVTLHTASNGALCGVHLSRNKRYVLSGSERSRNLRLELCDSFVQQIDTQVLGKEETEVIDSNCKS